MKEDLGDYEIHPLDIVGLLVITGKCPQNMAQACRSFGTDLEKRVIRECPADISFDLP